MAQRAIHLASPIVCGKGNTVSLRMAAFSKGHANLMGYSLPAVTRSDPNGRRFFALKNTSWVVSSADVVHGPDVLLMDGTADIRDLVTGEAFSMTGTPTTETLLGATAPVISTTGYTTCTIPVPYDDGSPLTILCVAKTPWTGSDLVRRELVSNRLSDNDLLSLQKLASTNLALTTRRAGGAYLQAGGSIAEAWAAGVPHIVIGTIDSAPPGTAPSMQLFLDGVSLTDLAPGAGTGRELLGPDVSIGRYQTGEGILEGSILAAIWDRVLAPEEIAELSALEDWGELTRGTVTAAMAGAPNSRHVVTDIVCSSDLAGAQVELLDGDELIFQAQI